MRLMFLILAGALLAGGGCTAVVPQENAITIVNADAVDADLLERVRAFAQKELHVLVRTSENLKLAGLADFQALEKAAIKQKQEQDISYIVLSKFDGEEPLTVYSESGVALVNVQALQTNDAEKFAKRIQRMVMRAAAFVFELPPTPDPFCVTRDYRSLDDLDRMGMNYSPPWQARYADEAAQRGLLPLTPAAPAFPSAR